MEACGTLVEAERESNRHVLIHCGREESPGADCDPVVESGCTLAAGKGEDTGTSGAATRARVCETAGSLVIALSGFSR